MTVKIDIVSGFLGAGKTTLIKKLLLEKLMTQKVVLIENEFGQIGIDSGILKNSGVEIKEINSGCICCSLVGDFTTALKEVYKRYSPERIIIEPSGVGKLSSVIDACSRAEKMLDLKLNMCISVVDAIKYKMYSMNFAEFFHDQIEKAQTVILSRTKNIEEEKLISIVKDIQDRNNNANIITTDWDKLSAEAILSVAELEKENTLEKRLRLKLRVHSNSNSNSNNNSNNHSANKVFSSWGVETPRLFSEHEVRNSLEKLATISLYGKILRAKGIVRAEKDNWLQFDYVPGEVEIKPITPDYTGRICVIGEQINSKELLKLFRI